MVQSRSKFTLDPSEVVIRNTKGWGAGGAKVAASHNCVVATHQPTKISVKCHDTRSLDRNTTLALKRLTDQVEMHLYGSQSSVAIKHEVKRQKNEAKRAASKENQDKRIGANKLKRQEAEMVRKEEFEKFMRTGLPYLESNTNTDLESDMEETEGGETEGSEEETEGSEINAIWQPQDTVSESRDTLKSLFGSNAKNKNG